MRYYAFCIMLSLTLGGAVLRADELNSLDHWVEANLMMADLEAHYNDLNFFLGWAPSNTVARAATARAAHTAAVAFKRDIEEERLFAGSPTTVAAAEKLLKGFEAFTLVLQQTNAAPPAISNALDAVFGAAEEMGNSIVALCPLDPLVLKAEAPPVEGHVPQDLFGQYVELTIGCTPYTDGEKRLKAFKAILAATDNAHLRDLCLLNMATTCFDGEKWPRGVLLLSNGEDRYEEGLGFLERAVQAKRYSPVLLECWRHWRARTQESKHGMSNWSKIPNHLYNSRRRHLAGVVLEHVKRNPDDRWALHQLYGFCVLKNYMRGGPVGHTGIFEIAEVTDPGWYTRVEMTPCERIDVDPDETGTVQRLRFATGGTNGVTFTIRQQAEPKELLVSIAGKAESLLAPTPMGVGHDILAYVGRPYCGELNGDGKPDYFVAISEGGCGDAAVYEDAVIMLSSSNSYTVTVVPTACSKPADFTDRDGDGSAEFIQRTHEGPGACVSDEGAYWRSKQLVMRGDQVLGTEGTAIPPVTE